MKEKKRRGNADDGSLLFRKEKKGAMAVFLLLLLLFFLLLSLVSLPLSLLTEVHEDGAGHVASTRGLVEVAVVVFFVFFVVVHGQKMGMGKQEKTVRAAGREGSFSRRRSSTKRKKKGFVLFSLFIFFHSRRHIFFEKRTR